MMRQLSQLTILFLIPMLLIDACNSTNTIYIGKPHNLSVQMPVGYEEGFVARAFVMWCDKMSPSFKAAVSVEAVDGAYSCSLQVFLGDVMVWSSGHYSPFYTTDRCLLHLTANGDLQLKGHNDQLGWRTGTSQQGVQRLQILKTGNLVLLDALNRIKWQSFNFPTDVMLRGQKVDVATSLTTVHNSSTTFYSLEIERDRAALYLNSGSGSWRYSYWEFKPSNKRNITYLKLGYNGLELFGDQYKKIAKIPIPSQNIRFLALGRETGNLGLYSYSPRNKSFSVSFQALNSTCDLPLACKPYGICTSLNTCSCIRDLDPECNKGEIRIPGWSCGKGFTEMLELEHVSSVLRGALKMVNTSKQQCGGLCIQDCACAAALYRSGECYLYGVVMGVRQVSEGIGMSYMIKVPKKSGGKSDVKKWVLVLVVLVDAFIVLLVLGGLGYYYLIHRRKHNSSPTNNTLEGT